jgi:tetratricopeptide (TPR) repeat protein
MQKYLSHDLLQHGGSFHFLNLPSSCLGGTANTNPSIFTDGEDLFLNIRKVQYMLYHSEFSQKFFVHCSPLAYLNPENDITLTTTNYLCKLDPNTFTIESFEKVDTSELDVKPLWEFVGLEDARIVKWDNKLFLCGVRRDTTTNGVGRMEMSEIVDGREVKRTRIEPPTPSYCEKNWMPVIDMPYHFVKWTNPTEVVKVNVEDNSSKTVFLSEKTLDFPRDIRGGSQVIPYKDYRIALTHEVDLWYNEQGKKDAQYYHRFIVWDKEWNIVGTSEEFKIFGANIEFSCGITTQDDNVLITIGFQDSTAFLVKIPNTYFENLVGLSTDKVELLTKASPKILECFAKSPESPENNYTLANFYFNQGLWSSAMSFYLRGAELFHLEKKHNNAYECLLKIAECISKEGNRKVAEKSILMNAISYLPDAAYAFLKLSQYFESVENWQESNLYATLALSKKNKKDPDYYMYLFQLAVSLWWVGDGKQSRALMFELAENYSRFMDKDFKALLQKNITSLGSSSDPFLPYTPLSYPSMRYHFEGLENIKKNYSQTYQDLFVLSMLKGKKEGVYLEIGAADPFYGSNTALLETQFEWKGVSIEILEHEVKKFTQNRKNPIVLHDATTIDYADFLIQHQYPKDIDYLQVDCEPPSVTYEILTKIPFDKHRFAVITFEHDYYADLTKLYREKSREFLTAKGYLLVGSNISPNDNCPYEDWWVHPDLVDSDVIELFLSKTDCTKHAQKYMFGEFS